MKVKFSDVGRNEANWIAECEGDEFNYDWLLSQVRPHLVSSYIDFYMDGRIKAGFHTVGRFEII